MREVELKFGVPPEQHRALARAPLLARTRPMRRKLHAIYFDTADGLLSRHGMALRVRREGRRWIQCLKAGHSGEAGLHARDEWEVPRPDATLDLGFFADTPLARVLPTAAAMRRVRPVFEVEMRRTTWTMDCDDGRVEIALDRGEVRRGRRRAPISELEIESVSGSATAVFSAAEGLIGHASLRPSATSKAERGYALARGAPPAPVKARSVALDRGEDVEAAARRIVSAALAQLQANEEGLLASDDPEYLHQFRVGLRRLRSALRVFRDLFDAQTAAAMRADCRWLSRVTGEARDLDVFVERMLPVLAPAGARGRGALLPQAREERRRARENARAALRTERYTRFILRFARWLASPARGIARPVRRFAKAALDRAHRKAMRGVRGLAGMNAAERHRVRIRLKRLRYACEALATLFDPRDAARYIGALARLQHELGDAADARASLVLLDRFKPAAALGAIARAQLAASIDETLPRAMRHVKALRSAPRFWR